MSKPRAEPHLCKKQNGTTNHPTPGYQRDWFADGKKEIKSCISTLLKLSEEGDPPSSMVEPGYLHSSLPVPTMPGFCAPHPMMEYTYTPRAPSITLKGACPAYSSIFPAMPACQRHSKASKLWGARARDGMENIASERRLFWGFASENQNSKWRNYNSATQQSRGGLPAHYKEIICPVTMALQFYCAFSARDHNVFYKPELL